MRLSDPLVANTMKSKVTVLRTDELEILSQAVVEIGSVCGFSTLQTNQWPLMHRLEPVLERRQLVLKRKKLIREIQPEHRNSTLHRISMVHNPGEVLPCTDNVAFGAGPESEIGR